MVNSLEMCIIYCAIFVLMVIYYLPLKEDCMMLDKAPDRSKSTIVSVCSSGNLDILALLLRNTENSGILEPSSYSYKLAIGRSYKPPSTAKTWSSESINTQIVLAKAI
jgi:hypothetical protein